MRAKIVLQGLLFGVVLILLVQGIQMGVAQVEISSTSPAAPTGYILATVQKNTSTHKISLAVPNPVVSCIGATQPTCGTAVTLPTCMGGGTGSTRGWYWDAQGTTGVKDNVQVCAKDASDVYAWRTIY